MFFRRKFFCWFMGHQWTSHEWSERIGGETVKYTALTCDRCFKWGEDL